MSQPKAQQPEQDQASPCPLLQTTSPHLLGLHPQQQHRARVRNNQRNSRSKRQAYVKDLELEGGECVRLGAQANAGMQLAARRVALENGFLRDLLRERGLDAEALRSWTQQFWQNRSERPALDVEASVSTASCLARTGLLTQQSCSTPTLESSTTCTPDEQARRPTQAGEPPQTSAWNEDSFAPEVFGSNAAEDVAAPSWGFDSWLDDLYDANGIFNENLGDALDSFIAADVIAGDQTTTEAHLPFAPH